MKKKKKGNVIATIIIEYVWVHLNKQGSKFASNPKHAKILSLAKFWMWQDSQYVGLTQDSELARICLDRVLKIAQGLNMPGF